MLKNILKLDGAQQLESTAQKNITGGITKACANAWASMYCVTSSTKNCPLSLDGEPGIFMCGKCCY